jgi:hypothetical protein
MKKCHCPGLGNDYVRISLGQIRLIEKKVAPAVCKEPAAHEKKTHLPADVFFSNGDMKVIHCQNNGHTEEGAVKSLDYGHVRHSQLNILSCFHDLSSSYFVMA